MGDDKKVGLWQDWGPGGEHRNLVTVQPSASDLPKEQLWNDWGGPNLPSTDVTKEQSREAPLTTEERDLNEAQAEAAGTIGDQLLADCPDPDGMREALEELSEEALNLIGHVLATKMPRTPLDLIFAIEDKATLARTVEIKQWYRNLPEHIKNCPRKGKR